jgi:alkaline phosphatase D
VGADPRKGPGSPSVPDDFPSAARPARRLDRRSFLTRSAAAAAGVLAGTVGRNGWAGAAAIVVSEKRRPALPSGVMSGDVSGDGAIVWSRTDRPARLIIEWATNEAFNDRLRVAGAAALPSNGLTAHADLQRLPPGQQIFYRAVFEDLAEPRIRSQPVAGRFRTPPESPRDVTLCFSGDEAGQGWGIDRQRGGMRLYETMRVLDPDAFIHAGDQIYADGVIRPEVPLADGTIWRNVTTAEKSRVAETLDDFRGNYAYNQLDENRLRFAAQVPFLVQWDDHEVRNNWYSGQIFEDDRYRVKQASVLAARGRRALFDYNPIRRNGADPARIYRRIAQGPLLDIFLLDERSYRGPNGSNRSSVLSRDSAFLGAAQLSWLEKALASSRAVWKVVAGDMPIGLVVPDRKQPDGSWTYDNWSNGDAGPPRGRELELARLFSWLRRRNVRNVIWTAADVHYATAIRYEPRKARFPDFLPFWEFVAGPIHAGTFAECETDPTFGPEARFVGVPRGMKPNRPPSEGLQFFGMFQIDGKTGVMTASLRDVAGKVLFLVDLEPDRPGGA